MDLRAHEKIHDTYSTSQNFFAAEYSRPLRAANRRLPSPAGNSGVRQSLVIFTPQAALGPMLQTVMDTGTSFLVITLRESQVTTERLTGGNAFRRMLIVCIVYIVYPQN